MINVLIKLMINGGDRIFAIDHSNIYPENLHSITQKLPALSGGKYI